MTCLPCKRIPSKILGIIIIFFIGFALATAYMLNDYHATLMKDRQAKTQQLVENATNLVNYYYEKFQKDELSEDQAKHYALAAIKQISLEQESYYWVMDTVPAMVMHPVQPSMDGMKLGDYIGPDGRKLFHEMVAIAKNQGTGFVHYQWTKPGTPPGTLFPKVSYIKMFKPWSWIVGAGVYVDDVNAAYWNAVYITVGLFIACMMFILALAMTVSESLKKS
ncbi:MAG: cache domain-containing protein [Alphaproteobacteria bacterium]|nr:cache domain-containing protein [Alphaproteobacteria bacterium]